MELQLFEATTVSCVGCVGEQKDNYMFRNSTIYLALSFTDVMRLCEARDFDKSFGMTRKWCGQ